METVKVCKFMSPNMGNSNKAQNGMTKMSHYLRYLIEMSQACKMNLVHYYPYPNIN